jgi:hypothetical protein
MYENGRMKPVEIIVRRKGRRRKNDGEGKTNQDIL